MTTNELLYDVMLKSEPVRKGIFVRDYKIDSALKRVTGFSPDELQVKSKRIELVEPRHIGMFFYMKAGYSSTASALRFHRDHATAIFALRKILSFYGRKCEKKLTEMIDKMSEETGIKTELTNETI